MARLKQLEAINAIHNKAGSYGSATSLKRALMNAGEDARSADNFASSFFSRTSTATSTANNAVSTLSSVTNPIKSIAKGVGSMAFATAYDQNYQDRSLMKMDTIQSAFNGVIDNGLNVFDQITSALTATIDITTSMIKNAYEREGELLLSITQNGGMAGDFATGFKDTIMSVVPEAQKLGISFDDVKNSTQSMVVNSQKFATYQGETILNALKISAAYGQSAKYLLENTEGFRDVGISLSDASGLMEKAGKQSIAQGLSARATTKNITENLKELNAFGFKNGVEGLSKMVREAQALNFDMKETFGLAKKLYDPEGAIDLAANLQVIGGAFGDLNDPIKLMYDATNNVESLQTSILGAARSLATYNAEQGRFEVTGANLRRAKAMSDALGISMEQLTSSAVKGQLKMQALSEIDVFNLSDDQKEFVSNLATMKEGVIGFELPKKLQEDLKVNQSFIAASSLSASQLTKLAEAQKRLADRTTDDVIRDQYTVATQTLNSINAILLTVGNMAKGGIDNSDIYNTVLKRAKSANKSMDEMTPEEITKMYNDVVNSKINPMLTKLISMSETALEAGNEVIQQGTQIWKNNGGQQLLEKGKEKAGEAVDAVKEIVSKLIVSVDINSSSSELAGIVVNEINKNPQLRSDLASNMVKRVKDYVG